MIYQQHHAAGLEARVIIWQDPSGKAPTRAYCDQVTRQFKLTMPVLIDRHNRLAGPAEMAQRHTHVLLERGAKVWFKKDFDDEAFMRALTELMAR